jgi:hypothetical protein
VSHPQVYCRAQTKICQDIFLAIEKQGYTKVSCPQEAQRPLAACMIMDCAMCSYGLEGLHMNVHHVSKNEVASGALVESESMR